MCSSSKYKFKQNSKMNQMKECPLRQQQQLLILLFSRIHRTTTIFNKDEKTLRKKNYIELITTWLHDLINICRAKFYPLLFLFHFTIL